MGLKRGSGSGRKGLGSKERVLDKKLLQLSCYFNRVRQNRIWQTPFAKTTVRKPKVSSALIKAKMWNATQQSHPYPL